MLGVVPALVLLVAGSVDVDGVVTLETRGGEAPLRPGQAPEATLAGVLTPGVSLTLRAPSGEVQVGYGLRIYLRETRVDPNAAPLFLHTLTFTGNTHATARLDLKAQATVMTGAADYAYLPSILSPSTPAGTTPGGMAPAGMASNQVTQASLAVAPQLFSASAGAGADVRLTRTAKLAFAVIGMHHRLIGETSLPSMQGAMATSLPLPQFTSAKATPGLALRLTRLDELTLESAVEYQNVSKLISYSGPQQGMQYSLGSFAAIPNIAWKAMFPTTTHLELKAGIAFSHLTATIPLNVDTTHVTPIGGASLDGRLLSVRDTVLTGGVAASVEYYLDPVLGTAAPHGVGTAGLTLGLLPDWSVALQGNFTTSFKAHPRIGVDGTPFYWDEVAAAVSLPVRHRLSNDGAVEVGGRWADRSPFFTAPNAGFHQRQLWLYVLVTGTTPRGRHAATP